MANVDPSGTCTIFYGFSPSRADSSFPKPKNMATVRRIDLHFHLTKDNGRVLKVVELKEEGPLRHWLNQPRGVPHPPLTIILTHDGEFMKQGMQYSVMICALHGLMRAVGACWSETVVVKLQYAKFGNSAERGDVMKAGFENHLGPATMLPGGEGHHFKFNPRHYRDEQNKKHASGQAMREACRAMDIYVQGINDARAKHRN